MRRSSEEREQRPPAGRSRTQRSQGGARPAPPTIAGVRPPKAVHAIERPTLPAAQRSLGQLVSHAPARTLRMPPRQPCGVHFKAADHTCPSCEKLIGVRQGSQQLVDSSGNVWTLLGGVVYENGQKKRATPRRSAGHDARRFLAYQAEPCVTSLFEGPSVVAPSSRSIVNALTPTAKGTVAFAFRWLSGFQLPLQLKAIQTERLSRPDVGAAPYANKSN
jgi:hypothetical protein